MSGLSPLGLWGGRRVIARGGVEVRIREGAASPTDDFITVGVLEAAPVHAGMRVTWMRGWELPFPTTEADGNDTIGATAEHALGLVMRKVSRRARIAVMRDDQQVRLHTRGSVDKRDLDLLVDAVVLLATWDVPLCRLLLALPDAWPVDDAPGPAVVLDPDGVRVGLDGERLVVRLGERKRQVERERDRILAAVAAVRNEVAEARGYR